MSYLTGVCKQTPALGSIDRLAAQIQSVAIPDEGDGDGDGSVANDRSLVNDSDATKVSRLYPFNTGCLPLNYSGNPGVNGVSYRGVKAELERLREDVAAATSRAKPVSLQMPQFDPSQPAVVPQPVPQLPKDFRETPAITELRRLLCATTADGTIQRIGFYGMGGIGKTVASAALLRDENIRAHFDQFLFLPLGQSPVMEKIRCLMYVQLTGMEMKVDWTEEQKLEVCPVIHCGYPYTVYEDSQWISLHRLFGRPPLAGGCFFIATIFGTRTTQIS